MLIPLFDGEGNSSYPFAYMSTVLIVKEGNQSDCSIPQEMTQYLSWIYTNQHVSDHMSALGWAPLTVAYRKMIIDVLGTVTCDDEEVLTTAYLIGEGTSRPALSDLAGQYPSNTVTQKYFTSDMATAIVDMKQRTPAPAPDAHKQGACLGNLLTSLYYARRNRLCRRDDRRYRRTVVGN